MLREKQRDKVDVSSTYFGNTNVEPSEQLGNSDSQRKQCRICLEENDEQYVKPCMCSGSIGSVHVECIRYYIYRQFQGSTLRKLPSDYMRISCEMCNREIRFEFDIVPRVDCSPCSDKTKAWTLLLILMVVFSMLLGALLIVIIFYYTEEAGKDLFKNYAAGIWIVIAMAPLVSVALLISIYYFVAENLSGNLVITKVLNRGERPSTKKKNHSLFDFEKYSLGE